ncbi:hypothetical protein WOLCODRAFT_77199 [Wolfiporia cocos MD-104 SS10]|uniref:DUF6533 domain-containing protein n=1 Tax=Wolfiporia cocos (strain MD-104) TaxID=742152 RepID=A0A2H3JYM0_WOLCO|nr:hypothetical protein WOLCODRAFT_77199 [Wolfiporia cocos MD-104 SS10]
MLRLLVCADCSAIVKFLLIDLVLVLYEHLITSDQDVTFVWNYQLTGTTALLFLNRFILIISCVSNILASLNFSTEQSCSATSKLVLDLSPVGFSALRAYAITNRGWHWAMLVLLTGSISAGAVIVCTSFISITLPY